MTAIVALLAWALAAPAAAQSFTDVTASAGFTYAHGWVVPLVSEDGSFDERRHFAGGVAAGDYDNDGWVDLYAVRGDSGPNQLFRNRGDGTFAAVGTAAGVALPRAGSGPLFADLDGDGWLDLLVGGVEDTLPTLYRNDRDGTFTDVSAASGLLATTRETYSAAAGDYDRDGDLDLLLAHWNAILEPGESSETLWRNDGGLRFTDVSRAAGVVSRVVSPQFPFDFTFTPNFADLDDDGWPDILLAGDIGTSTVLRNRGDGTFADITDAAVITDENGMGAAVGDYDRDGVLDWFVSSIWDPDGVAEGNWGVSGNRLYRGRGDGTFTDVTDGAGVRVGYWGWAATWLDVDNDADLDLFHVNGFGRSAEYEPSRAFFADPAPLFVANGDGTFVERAAALGLDERGMGRGVVSLDYDRDGDLDLFVANSGGPPRLWRNDGVAGHHFLALRLRAGGGNSHAVGARVQVSAAGVTQLHEVRAGSNYVSQDPSDPHFGLGTATAAAVVRIRWPDGSATVLTDVAADQRLDVAAPAAACSGDCNGDRAVLVDELVQAVRIALGEAPAWSCAAADRTRDGGIDIADLIAALAAALNACAPV